MVSKISRIHPDKLKDRKESGDNSDFFSDTVSASIGAELINKINDVVKMDGELRPILDLD